MKDDLVFLGMLGVLVSLLFLYMTFVEIPFYPEEILVQKVVAAVLGVMVIVVVFGIVSRQGARPEEN